MLWISTRVGHYYKESYYYFEIESNCIRKTIPSDASVLF